MENDEEETVATDTTAAEKDGTRPQETRQNNGVWRVNPDKVMSLPHAFPDRFTDGKKKKRSK